MKPRNLKSIIKYWAVFYKLDFNSSIFYNYLTNHPYYPSLNSLSDTLDEWHIDNVATKIETNHLSKISYPAIAHCKSDNDLYYVLLKGIESDNIIYFDSEKGETSSTLSEFGKIWTGIVLLMLPNEKSGILNQEKLGKELALQKIQSYFIYIISIFIACITFFTSNNLSKGITFILILTGLFTCILLLQNEFGKPNDFISKFCNINNKTDCDTILKSSSSKIFDWLSWAEVGFFYFAGSCLSFIISNFSKELDNFLPILLILICLALPYTIFSIYYQAIIAKKWCTLCLAVQIILWAAFIMLFPHFSKIQYINSVTIQLALVGFLLPIVIWLSIKPFIIKAKQQKVSEKELASYYRNYELFSTFLERQKRIKIEYFPNEIILGNPDAELEILIVCSVFCNPCANAHLGLDKLLDFYEEELKIIVRFAGDHNLDSERNTVAKHIFSLNPDIQHKALNDWFATMDYSKWSNKYPTEMVHNADQLIELQNSWCKHMNIAHTPTIFINGYELKEPYSFLHLKYHMRRFIETTVIEKT